MSEFNRGAEYVRDNILASIIGLQNGIRHSNLDDPTYKAYQKVYNLIKERYGDMFDKFKNNEIKEDKCAVLGFKQPTIMINPYGIKIHIGTQGKEDWCVEIPNNLVKKKCRKCKTNTNVAIYNITEEHALTVAEEFTNIAKRVGGRKYDANSY